MDTSEWISRVPKAEIHVHLEGSVGPDLLRELARRNRVELPVADDLPLHNWFRYRDFDHFIQIYLTISRCFRAEEDYRDAVLALAREHQRQDVVYAEVTFSPSTHRMMGVESSVWREGLREGRRLALADHGVEMNWVFDIVRNMDEGDNSAFTTRMAIENQDIGVVALGLGGKEEGNPPARFARWFTMAREAGLHSTPHAGEHAGPASVRDALDLLGAERIGHGVRAIEDPDLVRRLAGEGVTLEVCPTSNLRLGVYPGWKSHPVGALHKAGVRVTLNTDDPPLFNTTLADEWTGLAETTGASRADLERIVRNGFEAAFLPDDRKQGYLARVSEFR